MNITVKEIDIFPAGDDKSYDVVKFDVPLTKTLLNARKDFEEELPKTQTCST